jgi:TM2 domain-containing membrane protein YozV
MTDELNVPEAEEPQVPEAAEVAAPAEVAAEPVFTEAPAPAAPEIPAPPAPPAPEYAPPAPPAQQYAPAPPPPPSGYAQPAPGYAPAPAAAGEKSKVVAGVLGILLGAFGVHKFYLGYTKEGIILLAVSLVSFGMLAWASSIVGLIEGIMYLTKSDQEFEQTYVVGRKAWF